MNHRIFNSIIFVLNENLFRIYLLMKNKVIKIRHATKTRGNESGTQMLYSQFQWSCWISSLHCLPHLFWQLWLYNCNRVSNCNTLSIHLAALPLLWTFFLLACLWPFSAAFPATLYRVSQRVWNSLEMVPNDLRNIYKKIIFTPTNCFFSIFYVLQNIKLLFKAI